MSNEVPRAANVEVLSDDEAAGLQRTSNPSGQLIIQKNKNRFVEEKERKKKKSKNARDRNKHANRFILSFL